MHETIPNVEVLLEHRDWLRRLAGRLVSDAHDAEDLAQDAAVAAMRSDGPRQSPRAWLSTILRRRAADTARSTSRRRKREAVVTVGERSPAPDPAESVEQLERFRSIAGAVQALPAPLREVVVLRYWEDLPPREIARRLDVPVETVRTRLKRAAARLRERLDQEYGSRQAWAGPLLLTGMVGPSKAVPVVLGVALILLGAGSVWCWNDYDAESTPVDAGSVLAASGTAKTGNSTAAAQDSVRAPVTDMLRRADGRVVDEDGNAAPRMVFGLESASGRRLLVATEADGRFRVPSSAKAGRYDVSLRIGRPLVEPTQIEIGGGEEAIVRVRRPGRRDRITGRVVDAEGHPVAGAEVGPMRTDAQGRFRMERRGGVFGDREPPRTTLVVQHPDLDGVSWETEVQYEWGSTGVVLRAPTSDAVRVRAIDAKSKQPLGGFRCTSAGWAGVAQDGVAALRSLRGWSRLPAVVTVLPDGAQHLPVVVRVPARNRLSGEVLTVEVPRRVERSFVVRTAAGKPVPGVLVELVQDHAPHRVSGLDVAPRPVSPPGRVPVRTQMLALLAAATSDAQGQVTLGMPGRAVPGIRFVLTGSSIAPREVATSAVPGNVLIVSTGSTVVGRVAGLERMPGLRRSHVCLEAVDGGAEIPPQRFHTWIPLDANGGFRITGVPAGDWELLVDPTARRLSAGRVSTDGRSEHRMAASLERLSPDQGEVIGSIQINAPLDGILIPEPSAMTDDLGRFGPKPMAVGKHGLDVLVRMDGTRRALKDVAFYEVHAGKRTRVDAVVQIVRPQLQLVTVDGQPACFEQVYLFVGEENQYTARTDAKGVARFVLPAGKSYTVKLDTVGRRLVPGQPRHVAIGTLSSDRMNTRLTVR